MVSGATSNDAAQAQHVQLIAAVDRGRNIADETLQRTAAAEYANEHIAGINLGESAGGQFEHVVGGAVGKRAHHNYITRTGRIRSGKHCYCPAKAKRRSCRTDLVGVDDVDFCVHVFTSIKRSQLNLVSTPFTRNAESVR